MRHYLATLLRRLADRLEPVPEIIFKLDGGASGRVLPNGRIIWDTKSSEPSGVELLG